jgi:hypothetical protein
MNATFRRVVLAVIVPLAFAPFSACGGGGGGGSSTGSGSAGTVNVQMTDAPYPISALASALVTVTEVSLQGPSSNGFVTIFSGSKSVDLLSLRNGLTDLLTTAAVGSGSYDQARVVFDSGTVTLQDGRTFTLKAPSASTAGIKVFISPPLEVVGGISQDLILDIDLASSFEQIPGSATSAQGIMNFLFHPVVRAVNASKVGRITGHVFSDNKTPLDPSDDTPVANASVHVQMSGTTIGTALTAADGSYAVIGLAPGTYDVVVEATGFQTKTVSSQTVTAGNATTVDLRITPN